MAHTRCHLTELEKKKNGPAPLLWPEIRVQFAGSEHIFSLHPYQKAPGKLFAEHTEFKTVLLIIPGLVLG